ncbi:MAG: fatty acid--CoA ligase, partial [Pseudomonadota bacterium]
LKTGDIGVQDARGYLKITDRKKDMFIVGGFNCYPAEIEKILLQHPEIADVAVIGAPDQRLGEVAHAYVVRTPGSSLTDAVLIAWARDAMANYKAPRKVIFKDTLPRNASGKVQKFLLAP